MAVPSQPDQQQQNPYPTDPVLAMLDYSVATILAADPAAIIQQVDSDVPAYLNSLLPITLPEAGDPCDNCDSSLTQAAKVAPMCLQRKIDLNTSSNSYAQANTAARSEFVAACDAWLLARSNYVFANSNAKLVFAAAVTTAMGLYADTANPDSTSRTMKLYYTMQQSAATALQSYETSMQTAAASLSAAAGALLVAHAEFVAALNMAETAKMIDDATALQNFWGAVEGVFDD